MSPVTLNAKSKSGKVWTIANDELPSRHLTAEGYVCQSLPSGCGAGETRFYAVDQGLSVIETRYDPEAELAISSRMDHGEPNVVVTLALEGSSGYHAQQGGTVHFAQGFTTITSFSSSIGERRYRAGQALLQLRISMTRGWFLRYFGEERAMRLFSSSGVNVHSHRPISQPGLLAARQMLNCQVISDLRQAYLLGQSLSLLACELDGIERPTSRSEQAAERILAERARVILQEEYRNPPTVDELAGRVGTNQLRLKQVFHRVFDNTPFGVLTEIRMEHAYRLLQSTGCHVATAAYAVGYNHPSNFSSAFTRHFGITPKSVAKK